MRKTSHGPPGILDVAARAGVSAATVSRCFNAPDLVRAPTRQRVAEASQQLGYIRNRNAGSLHAKFSGTFGLIVPTIDNAIFAEMINAFTNYLQENERTLLIAAHGYDLAIEARIVRSLLERRIDGIALVGREHDPVPLNMLKQREVPTVMVWNICDIQDFPSVGVDNKEAGRLIAQHLLALGHRDIALIFPETLGNDRAQDRLRGVREALFAHGVPSAEHRLYTCPYDITEAKIVTKELLATSPPSAIIAGNDIIAQGAVYAAQSEGISIPEQISIAGIGDFRGSDEMIPSLTTVRLPARRIGTEAARMLLEISQDTAQETQHMLPLELKSRASTQMLAVHGSRSG